LQAKKDQIAFALKKILRCKTVNTNFVPDQVGTGEGVDLSDLFSDINDAVDSLLDLTYLQQFFADHIPATIRILDSFNYGHPVWTFPIVTRVKSFLQSLKENITLEQLLKKSPTAEAEILKAIYCLVIFRQIMFADLEAKKNLDAETNRRQQLYDAIKM